MRVNKVSRVFFQAHTSFTSLLISALLLFLFTAGCGEPVQGLDNSDEETDAGEELLVCDESTRDGQNPQVTDCISSAMSCTFNEECTKSERCECDEAVGCFCLIGTRGSGRIGIDICNTGNDCASSLCVEGPDEIFYCSGDCATDSSLCVSMLPRCIDVAFIGTICTRRP